jgi:hypothetical protein
MNRVKSLETILVITIGFAVIYLLTGLVVFLYAEIGVGILGLLSARFSIIISKGWLWLGEIMGSIISKILLSLVFCLIILQSLIYRLFKGKRPLDRELSDSNYHIRNHEYTPSDMEELW